MNGKVQTWQLLLLIQGAMLLVGLRRPVFCAASLVFSEFTGGSVFIDLGGGVLSLRLVFSAAALVVLAPQVLSGGWAGLRGKVTVWSAVVFVIWATISNKANADIIDVTSQYLRYLSTFLIGVIVVPAAARARRDLIVLAWTALAGATLSGALATYQHYVVGHLWQGRAPGFTAHPVNLAAMLPVALMPGVALVLNNRIKSPTATLALWAGVLVTLVGLYFTYTRSFMLALAGAAVVLFFYMRGAPRWTMAMGMVVAISGFFAISLTSDSARYSTGTMSMSADGSTEARPILWTVAFQIAKENPILGVGRDGFRVIGPSYVGILDTETQLSGAPDQILGRYDPHNDYIYALVSWGIPGLVLFVLLHLVTAWNFHTAYRHSRDWLVRGLSAGGMAALAAWTVNALVHNAFDGSILLGVMMGFSVVLVRLAERGEQRPRAIHVTLVQSAAS
jgi:O-antigen ligase